MSKFTAGVDINLKWNGLYIEGVAGTEFTIPDAYYEEADTELRPVISGFTWTSVTDSGTSVVVEELDGAPSGTAATLVFDGATVAISGSTATISISASSSSSGSMTIGEVDGSPLSSAINALFFPGGTIAITGSSASYAYEYGLPVELGQAISEGTASTLVRSDHVHTITGALATADPTPITPGSAGSLGTGEIWRAAYEDHAHATPDFATVVSTGTSIAAGTASTFTRSDHVHSIDNSLATAAPPDVGTGAVGTAPRAAREDHTHTGAAGTGIAVSEIDGAPSSTGITGLVFSNGSVTIAGNTATVTTGGSSGVRVAEVDGSPSSSGITDLIFQNGVITISGTTATVAGPTAGAALAVSTYTRTSGDYTNNSANVWSNVDSTNMSLTLTTGARRVLLGFTGAGTLNTGGAIRLDVTIDGVRMGGTQGLVIADNGNKDWSFSVITDVLSAGSHNFKLQWNPGAGTATMYGSTANAFCHFYAQELADTVGGSVSVSEIDGSPSSTGITNLVFSNGSVAISGNTATVTTGGSSGVRVTEVDGSPSSSGITDLVFQNGVVSISGTTATVAGPTAGAALAITTAASTANQTGITSGGGVVDVAFTSAVSITTGARRCLVTFSGWAYAASGSGQVYVNLMVDGVALGGGRGLASAFVSTTQVGNLSFSIVTDVLSAGSHTFKVRAGTDASSITLSGVGSGTDGEMNFTVQELPDTVGGSVSVAEIDDSPSSTGITNLVFPNGSLAVSGSTATIYHRPFDRPPASPNAKNAELDSTFSSSWTWRASSGTPTSGALGYFMDTQPANPTYNFNSDLPGALVMMPALGGLMKAYIAFSPTTGTRWAVAARLGVMNPSGTDDQVRLVIENGVPSSSSADPSSGVVLDLGCQTGTAYFTLRSYKYNGGSLNGSVTSITTLSPSIYVAISGEATSNRIKAWWSSDGISWALLENFVGLTINGGVNYVSLTTKDGHNNSTSAAVGVFEWIRFLEGDNTLWNLGLGK